MNTITSSINFTIYKDIHNLLYILHNEYQIDIETLIYRYMPNISLEKKIEKQTRKNKKKTKHSVAPNDIRCMARCWGCWTKNKAVIYNEQNKRWTYGTQCPRKRNEHSDYCGTHYKQSLRPNGLSHGRFDKDPPHQHYLKFKKLIVKKKPLNE